MLCVQAFIMDERTRRKLERGLIWCGFAPDFVNYKKGCTRLTAASDKVYQLLAHGPWFSPGTPASSTTKIQITKKRLMSITVIYQGMSLTVLYTL
jgi:3-deoxy-D-arabino-heptulosonate 7-phosphate (DAHP) synthase class II